MTQVNYVTSSGERRPVAVEPGTSVMRGAIDHGLPGIVAECGGELTCATCHVHVDDAWATRLPPPGLAERELLEMVEDYRPSSRLSCQIIVDEALDGLVVTIPEGNG